MPLAVIAKIGTRRGIVGFVPLHAVRHGIIAGRRCCGNRAVVIISVRVVIVVGAVVVIAVGRPQADTDSYARPEAAAMTVVPIAAAVVAATGPATRIQTGLPARPADAAVPALR